MPVVVGGGSAESLWARGSTPRPSSTGGRGPGELALLERDGSAIAAGLVAGPGSGDDGGAASPTRETGASPEAPGVFVERAASNTPGGGDAGGGRIAPCPLPPGGSSSGGVGWSGGDAPGSVGSVVEGVPTVRGAASVAITRRASGRVAWDAAGSCRSGAATTRRIGAGESTAGGAAAWARATSGSPRGLGARLGVPATEPVADGPAGRAAETGGGGVSSGGSGARRVRR
ncbi:hypothetical protein [Candidatus Amarobacter glycogenicus]|uniref:hypothetical protein n=1 Tax=Candidatus Amarobacter glycogenicus TaxID=3140699 RepID=UPI002A15B477|nr:hypothetical protein [Dehalococcoidia bacterium]